MQKASHSVKLSPSTMCKGLLLYNCKGPGLEPVHSTAQSLQLCSEFADSWGGGGGLLAVTVCPWEGEGGGGWVRGNKTAQCGNTSNGQAYSRSRPLVYSSVTAAYNSSKSQRLHKVVKSTAQTSSRQQPARLGAVGQQL